MPKPGDKPLPSWRRLKHDPVIDVQGCGETLGHGLADGTLAVFHFGYVALRDAHEGGQGSLRQAFLEPGPAQPVARAEIGVDLAPVHRFLFGQKGSHGLAGIPSRTPDRY